MGIFQVLIVDNQRRERQSLRAALHSPETNFKVTDVASGEEAMLVLTHQPVDLLVVEYYLAGMSGLELVQKVRQRHPHVKTILLAEKDNSQVREQITQANVQAHFFKPVDIPPFQQAVRRCLGLEQPQRKESLAMDEAEDASGSDSPLARLRKELDAITVVMFAGDGQVEDAAGELPSEITYPSLTTSVGALLKAGAESSLRMGNPVPSEALYLSGIAFDVFLVRIGRSGALAVLTNPNPDIEHRVSVFRGLEAARDSLLHEAAIPKRSLESRPEPFESPHSTDPAFDALIGQATNPGMRSEEIASFWDAAAEKAHDDGMSRPGMLTYEQARKLGLTPPDDEP